MDNLGLELGLTAKENYEDIADAIRNKKGDSSLRMRPEDMPGLINSLNVGESPVELEVTQNGTYTRPGGYSPVIVDINNISPLDEGKVVRNGVLQPQSSLYSITQNGAYNTTYYSSVQVNVEGGGGSGEHLIFSDVDNGSIVISRNGASSTVFSDVGSGNITINEG